ncbi:hemicentin-1 [Elysia marginata]|uniref:Hemicentin-1 n=1 Tax=Elysia marginata TaxID=1093978 RepID=A0AAV4H9A6_9GAST|nr:hemicentin-1 [Elysia marginata]
MTCAATSTSQPPSSSLILVYVLKQNGNVITQPRTSSFLIKGISAGNAGTRFQCAAYELNTVTNRLTGLESGDSEVYVLDPQYNNNNHGDDNGDDVDMFSFDDDGDFYNGDDETDDDDGDNEKNNDNHIDDDDGGGGGDDDDDDDDDEEEEEEEEEEDGEDDEEEDGDDDDEEDGDDDDDDDKYHFNNDDDDDAPTLISVSPNQTSYTLKRDETIPDIECRAACNPVCDFQWYKDITLTISVSLELFHPRYHSLSDFSVPPAHHKAPNRESIVAQGPVLQLGTVTSDEDGTYVCAAVNTLGERLLPVKVEVQVSLGEVTFDPSPDSYTVREGTPIPAILCNSECVPACKFEWFKDGRFLYESDGINFGEVGRADSGDYTCRATNDRGSREKNLKIEVQYPPSRATLTPAALNYELEENAAILPDIACAADCQPDCEILWRKEGSQATVSLNSLALGTATRADTGRYQCLVRNQYGEQVSDIVNVKIFYSPESVTFDPQDASYNVEEGAKLEPITCSANCEPACSFSWSVYLNWIVAGVRLWWETRAEIRN